MIFHKAINSVEHYKKIVERLKSIVNKSLAKLILTSVICLTASFKTPFYYVRIFDLSNKKVVIKNGSDVIYNQVVKEDNRTGVSEVVTLKDNKDIQILISSLSDSLEYKIELKKLRKHNINIYHRFGYYYTLSNRTKQGL